MIQNLIEEIYDNYMNLDVRKVNDYLTDLQEKTNMTIEFIDVNLVVHALKLGKDEYKKFNCRKNAIKKLNTKYVQKTFELLDLYKANRINEVQIRSNLAEMIKKTIKIYPEYNEELNSLLNCIISSIYKNTYARVEIELFPKTNRNEENSKYVEELKAILIESETDEQALEKIRKFHYSDKEMEQIINKFSYRFANANEYLPRLIKLFDEYKKLRYHIKKDTTFVKSIDKEYDIKKSFEIIYNLVNSEYSVYEYCHVNKNVNVYDIKFAINSLIEFNQRKKIIALLNNRANTEFEQLMVEIKNKIVNNEIDIIDYYCLTKLSSFDFINILNDIDNKDIAKIKDFFYKSIKNFPLIAVKDLLLNKTMELNGKRIVNEREITRTDKIILFEFMKTYDIIPTEKNYIMCLNKYLNGNLNYNKIIKIKKIIEVAEYIVNNEATIEKTAQKFGYSISSIKKYINDPDNLQKIDIELYNQVKTVQARLIEEGHSLGGKTGIRGPIHTDFEAEEIQLQMEENKLTYEQASKKFDIPKSTAYEMVKRKQNRYKSFN